MRTRSGNFHDEAHGKSLRHYEFVADGSKTPQQVVDAIELASGLKFQGGPSGQHGYVNTSRRADGSLYVSLVLYEDCAVPSCPAGHGSTPHVRATDLPAPRQVAIKAAVGEHPKHRLTGDPANDRAVLSNLGWDEDALGKKRPKR